MALLKFRRHVELVVVIAEGSAAKGYRFARLHRNTSARAHESNLLGLRP